MTLTLTLTLTLILTLTLNPNPNPNPNRTSGGYSVVMAVPGVAAAVEVLAPQLDALQVAD